MWTCLTELIKSQIFFIFQYSNFGFLSSSFVDVPHYSCFIQPYQIFVTFLSMVLWIKLSGESVKKPTPQEQNQ